jgi:hypothetical protein
MIASCDQRSNGSVWDYVDIFIRNFDPETPLKKTMGALDPQRIRNAPWRRYFIV